jgi:cell pole-organizing protein PopZ
VSAIVQQRRGHARNMNNWMWARIAFQGFTVAAILGGTIAMGRSPQQVEARTAASAAAHAQQESAEFAARLRLAEEAHAEEEQGASARAEGAKARAEGGPPAGVRLLRHATTASGSAGEQPAGVRGMRHAEPAAGAAGDLPAGVQVLRQQERETEKQSRSWWKLW